VKNAPGNPVWIGGEGNEQVLGPDVVMLVLRRDALGTANRLLYARCLFHLCYFAAAGKSYPLATTEAMTLRWGSVGEYLPETGRDLRVAMGRMMRSGQLRTVMSYSKARLAAGLRCPWAPRAGFEPASP
jgi:hypothetical protein